MLALLIAGIDAHKLSVQTANENLERLGPTAPDNVLFELRPAVELDEPADSFDIITTTLVISFSPYLLVRT